MLPSPLMPAIDPSPSVKQALQHVRMKKAETSHERLTDVSIEKCDLDYQGISMPRSSLLNTMSSRSLMTIQISERRKRKDRVAYPEGSTFNTKTD